MKFVQSIVLLAVLFGAQQVHGVTSVKIETNMGNIIVKLYNTRAPKTVNNFLNYVRSGHYSNTIFHRVIDGFMIQGGGFDIEYKHKEAEKTVQNEADNGLSNDRGTIAMARTNEPHSASAQFFINVKDNHFLNHSAKTSRGWGYAVFGTVIQGMKVVDKIKKIKTGARGVFRSDVPIKTVIIKSISII